MSPFDRESLDLIRATLRAKRLWRDLALLNTGIDTMLRASDLLRLRVLDLVDHEGRVEPQATVRQQKTAKPVVVNLSERTREAILTLIAHQMKYRDDYLFTRHDAPHGRHLSEMALRTLVKSWAMIANLDPRRYSGHSLRRTRAAFIYRETRDIKTVQELLGHSSVTHTGLYLGVDTQTAAAVARKYEI
jgi:integrase